MGLISRLKQKADEKFSGAEKTEIDPKLVALFEVGKIDEEQVKEVLSSLEAYLVPDPSTRMGEAFKSGVDAEKGNFKVNIDLLAKAMTDASEAMSKKNPFGSGLGRASGVESKVGTLEREFISKSYRQLAHPLKRFLIEDMKKMNRERKEVGKKRLDLDAAKSKLNKAKSEESKATAEADVEAKQKAFDDQCELTLGLYSKLASIHDNQMECLKQFVETQMSYHAAAYQQFGALHKQL